MKKLFLLTLAAGLGLNSFAQLSKVAAESTTSILQSISNRPIKGIAAGRTTGVGDTFSITYINTAPGMDTLTTYFNSSDAIYDSGLVFGMNPMGDKAWGERFTVVGTDSTISVLGIVAGFGGTYNTASTATIDLKVWKQGAKTAWIRPTVFNSGFPDVVAATKTVPVTQLALGNAYGVPDSVKSHWFATPTTYLTSNFFVGCQFNYTWGTTNGDTIGLRSTRDGERHVNAVQFVSASDTTVINQNATMYSDGTWHDNFQEGFRVFNHLLVYPIIKIGAAVNNSVTGVNKNNLTFYGNYPNPAVNSTNVRFSLAKGTDVTISVMDVNGKVINTVNNNNLTAGEHTISLETSNLAAGNYIYVIRTAEGDGMASALTIAK